MIMAIKVRGNFIGATIIAVIYTVYILINNQAFTKPLLVSLLVILNALTIIFMYFAFSEGKTK